MFAILQIALGIGWGALATARLPLAVTFAERAGLSLVVGLMPTLWLPLAASFFFGIHTGAIVALAATSLLFAIEVVVNPAGRLRLVSEWRAACGSLRSDIQARVLFGTFVAYALLIGWLCHTHLFLPGPDGIYTGGLTGRDAPMHAAFATAFLERDNLHPPEYPFFVGWPLGYPFVPDFATASLMSLGASLRLAFAVTDWLAMMAVLLTFYALARRWAGGDSRVAPFLALLLFFCSGGMGFVYYVRNAWQMGDLASPLQFDYSFNLGEQLPALLDADLRLGNVIGLLLLPARCAAFGMAIGFATLLLLTGRENPEETTPAEFRLAGVLAGTLPLIHPHSFIAIACVGVGYLMLSWRSWPRWLGFFVPFSAVALPQILWIEHHVRRATKFPYLMPGYPYPLASLADVYFWLWNRGMFLPLAALAWWCSPLRLKKLTAPLLILFVVANLVSFQPNPWDNTKIFAYVQAGAAIAIGWYLAHAAATWRQFVAASALMVVLCLSGALAIGYEIRSRWLLLTLDECAAVEYVKSQVPPDAIFLTGSAINHPVPSYTGRQVVLGSNVWLLCHGVPYQEREAEVKEMFRGGAQALELLQRYKVSYVFVGPGERAEFPELNEAFFQHQAEERVQFGPQVIFRMKPAS